MGTAFGANRSKPRRYPTPFLFRLGQEALHILPHVVMAACSRGNKVFRPIVMFVVYRRYVTEQVAAGTWRMGGIVIVDILRKTRGSFACITTVSKTLSLLTAIDEFLPSFASTYRTSAEKTLTRRFFKSSQLQTRNKKGTHSQVKPRSWIPKTVTSVSNRETSKTSISILPNTLSLYTPYTLTD